MDTADVYSAGVSEEIVGEAVQVRHDEVFLETAFFMPMDQDDSLRRLPPDYIDLYQVHPQPEHGR